jgi:hypothetical protein
MIIYAVDCRVSVALMMCCIYICPLIVCWLLVWCVNCVVATPKNIDYYWTKYVLKLCITRIFTQIFCGKEDNNAVWEVSLCWPSFSPAAENICLGSWQHWNPGNALRQFGSWESVIIRVSSFACFFSLTKHKTKRNSSSVSRNFDCFEKQYNKRNFVLFRHK